jgi:hypothetical protein
MAFDLFSVHEPGAHWPDEPAPIALPNGEDDEYGPSESCAANSPETLLGLGVAFIGKDVDRAGKYTLNLGPRNTLFLAMRDVSLIPFESGEQPIHDLPTRLCRQMQFNLALRGTNCPPHRPVDIIDSGNWLRANSEPIPPTPRMRAFSLADCLAPNPVPRRDVG